MEQLTPAQLKFKKEFLLRVNNVHKTFLAVLKANKVTYQCVIEFPKRSKIPFLAVVAIKLLNHYGGIADIKYTYHKN